jgi:hypothetical protein
LITSNGISMGTNSISPLAPLSIPVSIGSSASTLQIGIANSSVALGSIPSLVASGTSTVYTAGAYTYTVPTSVNGSNVIGVMAYCWGAGGTSTYTTNTTNGSNGNVVGGGGGFMSGFYPCAGGTQLNVVTGTYATTPSIAAGGGAQTNAFNGNNGWSGGFSAIFAGTYDASTCLVLAGGGGGAGTSSASNASNAGNGGGGGYPAGSAPYQASTNGLNIGFSTVVTGGTQTTGGLAYSGAPTTYIGSLFTGSRTNGATQGSIVAGGGGFYGGGAGNTATIGQMGGGGGSSYFAANRVSLVSYSNGTTYTSFVTPGQINSTTIAPPGGVDIMTSLGLSNYGYGAASITAPPAGLVVLIPYVSSAGSCAVGLDARFLAV